MSQSVQMSRYPLLSVVTALLLVFALAACCFTVQGHLLELYGQCVACQQAYG